MFREQLAELRRSRKTLLHQKKSLVTFVADENVDRHTLLRMITIQTPYTTSRFLLFERQQLSEKEEAKFNSRLSAFLKGLVASMGEECIDYVLEFLVRVFNIDTYNAGELLFLLMPFSRYAEQIGVLCRNTSNSLLEMRSYSVGAIARATVKDARAFGGFVEYFKHYGDLHSFLDRMLDEIIERLKGTDSDYLSEIYQIFVHLIEGGRQEKALEIYHRLRTYLDDDSFVDILLPHYPENTIRMVEEHGEPQDIYEAAHRGRGGRVFLGDEQRLARYVQFLEADGRHADEFTADEFVVLRCLYSRRPPSLDLCGYLADIRAVKRLYQEMQSKIKLTRLLIGHQSLPVLFEDMNLEDRLLLFNESRVPLIELLTDQNHSLLIRNMERSLFEANYGAVLEKCIGFVSFDVKLFSRFVLPVLATETAKQNTVKLALHTGHSLVDYALANHCDDRVFLSYLLCSDAAYSASDLGKLVQSVKGLRVSSLVSDLAALLKKTGDDAVRRDACVWALASGFEMNVEPLVVENIGAFDSEFLWLFLLRTESAAVLAALMARDFGVVQKLYDISNYTLISRAEGLASVERVLIDHPNVFRYIDSRYDEIGDKSAVIAFALEHIADEDGLKCLLRGYQHLIEFRTHLMWPTIKMVIIEGLGEKRMHAEFIRYVFANISLFTDDSDLFAELLSSDAVVPDGWIAEIAGKGAPAADMIDELIKRRSVEMLPHLPSVSALLITHRKESVAQLFAKYSSLMYVYAPSILREFPERMDVLLHIDPRHSLKEIVSHVRRKAGWVPSCMGLINSILRQMETRSLETVRMLAGFLRDPEFADTVPEETFEHFVVFYVNSFGMAGNDDLQGLLSFLCMQRNPLFQRIVLDNIESNCDIFRAAFLHAVEDIMACRPDNLHFAARFIGYRPECVGERHLELCRRILCIRDEGSAPAIASLCRSNASILTELNDHIESKIEGNTDVEFYLATLRHLFERVDAYRINRDRVVPLAMLLSESRDDEIAGSARLLYEKLQFLD